jgi:VanZ family protein
MRPRRSRLPLWLAWCYTGLIVYASLQPFEGWTLPAPGTRYFLFAAPGHTTWFDVWANVLAYLPLGFFIALIWRPLRTATAVAVGLTALLSLGMESLQMLLPSRDASLWDLLANSAGGALGALAAYLLQAHTRWSSRLVVWRDRIFLPGRPVDAGLALLAIWLLLQLNPGIPMFGANYATVRGGLYDPVGAIVEGAQAACYLLGVGLFLASLLRRRTHVGAALLALILACLLLKAAAAALLLKPGNWEHWLRPGVGVGLAVGAVLLLALIWVPRRAQTLAGAAALLSALAVSLLAPDLAFAKAPLSVFDWHYGHLLNFNGLTHAGLQVWPVAAAVLLALAGNRPAAGSDPV